MIDLATGEEVARPVQSSPGVPYVLGLGDGSVIIAEELAGRFEVKAVDWRTSRMTPLGSLPFRDESFVFAPGSQAVLPGYSTRLRSDNAYFSAFTSLRSRPSSAVTPASTSCGVGAVSPSTGT